MMNKAESYKVSIYGDEYTLLSDEAEELVTRAAAQVDEAMREIAEKTGLKDSTKIAVLAALRVVSQLTKMKSEMATAQKEKEKLIDQIDQELFGLSGDKPTKVDSSAT